MSCDVSVITPTYNSSPTLKRALDSVYGQSLLPREIIVVDDGSDDWEQCRQIAASYPDTISIRFIHLEKNQGPSTARNVAVSSALCRYLAFLDADDVWYQDKIAIQYGLMTSHNLDLSMHQYLNDMTYRKADSGLSNDRSPPSLSSLSGWSLLVRNHRTPTVMVLKQKMVSFDASLRRHEDWKCWMELIAKHGCSGVYIKRVLAGGFKSGCGISGLSKNVKAMHVSRMLVLKCLVNAGNISTVQYLAGICMETVKYPLRILRVAFRNRALP